MINETKITLKSLYSSLDNEAKILNELKNNLMKGERYETARSVHRIESEFHDIQNMICRLLDELTAPERKQELKDKDFLTSLKDPDIL